MPYNQNKPAFASILEGVANGLQSGIQKREDAKKEDVQREKDKLSYYGALRQAGYTMEEASSRVNTTYGGQQHQGFLEKVFSQGGKKKDVFSPPSFDAYGEANKKYLYDEQGNVVGNVPKNSVQVKRNSSNIPSNIGQWKNQDLLNYIGKVRDSIYATPDETKKAALKKSLDSAQAELQNRLANVGDPGADNAGDALAPTDEYVELESPDGTRGRVPRDKAEYFLKKGAKLVQ